MDIEFAHVDELTAEFAYVVKALCEELGEKPDNFALIKYSEMLETFLESSSTRFIRTIDYTIDIPAYMAPENCENKLSFRLRPAPGSEDFDRHAHGIAEYRAKINPEGKWDFTENTNNTVTFWQWSGFREQYPIGSWIYFIRKADLKNFYRAVLNKNKPEVKTAEIPILPGKMLNKIYANTIKFLDDSIKKKEEYKAKKIPCKRGVMLAGDPGSGKTMTCKWLRSLCDQKDYVYRVVSLEDYRNAASKGNTAGLFKLKEGKHGMIFFDDMDAFVKDRHSHGQGELMNFLTQLDGINESEGVVFVFTTNELEDLDKAFVRPGRIDLFEHFLPPTEQLRRRFVDEKFSDDIKSKIDCNELIERTVEHSFAELEEIRKLLEMRNINGDKVELDEVLTDFTIHREEFRRRQTGYGFNQDTGKRQMPEYYDDESVFEMPDDD